MNDASEPQFEALLGYLKQQRGFDFSGYKQPSLMRRINKRMQAVSVAGYSDYVDYLEVHPEELSDLFDTILINVTTFFRDPAPWEYLSEHVIPRILRERPSPEIIRVWSAGCASGEEAYSLAMAFAEEMGADAFRQRVKVYATDVDEQALAYARLGAYTAREVEGLDAALRDRYFEHENGRYVFRADVRRSIIFGRHDLMQDAPISGLALLVCRNTLMYFNAEAQARIMARFHFALEANEARDLHGYLFLGRAELLPSQGNLFSPLDLKCRIFEKRAKAPRTRLLALDATAANVDTALRSAKILDAMLEESPFARIVVDVDGRLVLANQKARLSFSLAADDIGRPLTELEISHRPVELRPLIEQAHSELRPVTQPGVERRFPTGELQVLEVVVAPLHDEVGQPLGASVSLLDVTSHHRMQQELQRSREELRTVNEELQSSTEELETTNEELQSSNEELQSTNEELQTVNEELRTRTDELHESNAFLEAVLSGLESGTVVVDANLDVLIWNRHAEDLWGLREEEVRNTSFLNLDIGLPVERLRSMIWACLSGESARAEIALDATTRRGKSIRCRVTCSPLPKLGKNRRGVLLLMEEADR